jgi:hypothetical protein
MFDVKNDADLRRDLGLGATTGASSFLSSLRAGGVWVPLPERVRVEVVASGRGCRAETLLWSHSYSASKHLQELLASGRVSAELLDLGGSDISIVGVDLRVRRSESISADKAEALARALRDYWGGGWRRIHVQGGARVRAFDGTGKAANP